MSYVRGVEVACAFEEPLALNIVSAATAVSVSIDASAEVVVRIVYVPVVPAVTGLRISAMVQVCAPATAGLPVLRVIVTTCPEKAAANDPSIVEHVALVDATEVTTYPDPNVTLIFPVEGIEVVFVKFTVTVFVTPTVELPGMTFVDDRAPTVLSVNATVESEEISTLEVF